MYYDMKACGNRIRVIRKEKGVTQEQPADILKISVSMMSQIERGSKSISLDLLVDFTEHFQISMDYVIKGKKTSMDCIREQFNKFMDELSGCDMGY